MKVLWLFVACLMAPLGVAHAAPLQLKALSAQHRVWRLSEFTLQNVPVAANPFDPDSIAVDAVFTAPSGRTFKVPAFWFQDFSRSLEKSKDKPEEKLAKRGPSGWRVRWTPSETGRHRVRLEVRETSKLTQTAQSTLMVGPRAMIKRAAGINKSTFERGFARVEPTQKRFFQTGDNAPLPLLGENLCWHHTRGTYDYDDWFAGYSRGRMNYARLWMWHQAFGIEFFGRERQNYNQERAWQLDYVLQEAAQKGIYVMLCLDYHGIFQTEKDMWGSNDFWPQHAYNKLNGGPCASQNEFFTNDEAKSLYRKRLRYLIGRYGAFTSVLSWQFFNEIDNVYRFLKPADVTAWHDEMAKWLKTHDPYGHAITTSFGSAGEHKAMWQLPSLDYANWHWYGNWGGGYTQATRMAEDVARRFARDYGKPVLISEFGTHGSGGKQAKENDPNRRGLQQGIWAGVMAGTAGTAMPWWWESTHEDNLYPLWGALAKFLDGTSFGSAGWQPRRVSAPTASGELGEVYPNAAPFTEQIALSEAWGGRPTGRLALRRQGDGQNAELNGFVHGSGKKDLQVPFVIETWLGQNAKFVLHLNSVSNDAILEVKYNGQSLLRRELPNKDNSFERNNEYNEDIEIALPPGRTKIEVSNPGGDWLFFDWGKIINALPSRPVAPDGPPLDAWAIGDGAGQSTLVWAVDANFNWPKGSMSPAETLQGAHLTLHDLPDGNYQAQWWHTREGRPLSVTQARSQKGILKLPIIDFQTDVAARVTRLR